MPGRPAGALDNPNGITRYSKCPLGVLKAVFPFIIPLPYANQIIGITKVQLCEKEAPCRLSKAEDINGKGYGILYRDAVQPSIVNTRTKRPIFLSTKKNPAPAGEEEGRMILAARRIRNVISPWPPFLELKASITCP